MSYIADIQRLWANLKLFLTVIGPFWNFGSSDPKVLSLALKLRVKTLPFQLTLEQFQIVCGYEISRGFPFFLKYYDFDCILLWLHPKRCVSSEISHFLSLFPLFENTSSVEISSVENSVGKNIRRQKFSSLVKNFVTFCWRILFADEIFYR